MIHKANGGLSDARNAGMKISHGKFYSFVDGDDEISPNMLERLYKALRNTDSDVSMCRMEKIEACKSYVTRKYKFDCKQKILSSKEAIQLLLKDELDCSACLKLYSANVFGKIEFPFGKLFIFQIFYIIIILGRIVSRRLNLIEANLIKLITALR